MDMSPAYFNLEHRPRITHAAIIYLHRFLVLNAVNVGSHSAIREHAVYVTDIVFTLLLDPTQETPTDRDAWNDLLFGVDGIVKRVVREHVESMCTTPFRDDCCAVTYPTANPR